MHPHLPFSRRLVEASAVAAMLSAVYFAAGQRPPAAEPLALPFEAHIPFVPEAVWVYLPLYAVGFVVTVAALREARAFRAGLGAFVVVGLLALPPFLLLPIAGPRPPGPEGADLSSAFVRWLYANDPAGNTLPSLHVANATLCAWLCAQVDRRLGWAMAAAAAVIASSTLLLKQHWFVDIPAGVTLAVAGARAWRLQVSGELGADRLRRLLDGAPLARLARAVVRSTGRGTE